MTRVALPLSLAAALVLSACGSDPNTMESRSAQPRAAGAQTPTVAYTPGSGVVQAVTPAPRMASAGATAGAPVTTTRSEPGSSAGAGAAGAAGPYQRLAIRMDDGRIQYVDMAGPEVPPVGTRVQLTPDHQIVRQ